nr:hypothetical protein CFP56_47770 [Quercus suber]
MEIEVESWKMYFDEVTNQNGRGIEVLLLSLKGAHIPFSSRLNFPAINNAIEYEAYIMGLRAALGLGVRELKNQIVDALATMASMMDETKEEEARPIVLEQKEELAFCMIIEEDEEKNVLGSKDLGFYVFRTLMCIVGKP